MFLESIVKGIALLRFWQVWAALGVFAACNIAWLLSTALISGKEESASQLVGGLFWVFGGSILQAILIAFIIFYLLPILLGYTQAMPFESFPKYASQIVIAAIVAMITILVLSIVPFVNAILQAFPSLDNFIMCLVIFRLLSQAYIDEMVSIGAITGSVYPGFWQTIGYLIISGVLIFSIFMLVQLISYLIDQFLKSQLLEESVLVFFGPIYNIAAGLIPLFMYAQFVALSLAKWR